MTKKLASIGIGIQCKQKKVTEGRKIGFSFHLQNQSMTDWVLVRSWHSRNGKKNKRKHLKSSRMKMKEPDIYVHVNTDNDFSFTYLAKGAQCISHNIYSTWINKKKFVNYVDRICYGTQFKLMIFSSQQIPDFIDHHHHHFNESWLFILWLDSLMSHPINSRRIWCDKPI